MKKLKKLNLKNASLMTDSEMKMVLGGYSPTDSCAGKDLCAPCRIRVNAIGQDVMGKCSQNAFRDGRYCSDLNCHY